MGFTVLYRADYPLFALGVPFESVSRNASRLSFFNPTDYIIFKPVAIMSHLEDCWALSRSFGSGCPPVDSLERARRLRGVSMPNILDNNQLI